ncbi:hypothetical protein TRFO_23119 [Tritrichomonas foetus]|uniref:Calcineurin-like phosphoesterase domain-containing protein n=1 Tax=Tritrichomonas foetus TaxID=1144522 RepID=A0A1J4KAG3_9EUKA|nr:hypothetical protein TRFO_23119 [Tritrichomonas foetus]|eukprot:OHT08425.1 hypothetical protein TRFO_23119 [Tritrichomonas foetus]
MSIGNRQHILLMNQKAPRINMVLKNTKIYAKTIEVDIQLLTKALIVSDFHISQLLDVDRSTEVFFRKFNRLIQKENPSSIFILGDIFHWHTAMSQELYNSFFKKIEVYKKETFIIPGNHDVSHGKTFFCHYENGMYVHPIECDALILKTGTNYVCFGHHFKNNTRSHTRSRIKILLENIRFKMNCIPKDSLLICGHTHEDHSFPEMNSYSLGPFMADKNHTSYGILQYNNDSGFNFQPMLL